MEVLELVAVQLVDPTDWTDLIVLLTIMVIGSILGFLCLHSNSLLVMKIVGMILVIVSVTVPPVMESTREATIKNGNQRSIMKAYSLDDLEQDSKKDDDGMWLDPSAGRTTHVGARWVSRHGKTCYEGKLVMTYPTGGEPTGRLMPESSCSVQKKDK